MLGQVAHTSKRELGTEAAGGAAELTAAVPEGVAGVHEGVPLGGGGPPKAPPAGQFDRQAQPVRHAPVPVGVWALPQVGGQSGEGRGHHIPPTARGTNRVKGGGIYLQREPIVYTM
eukprot:9497514-Pyramimonas_sp.AAC.2